MAQHAVLPPTGTAVAYVFISYIVANFGLQNPCSTSTYTEPDLLVEPNQGTNKTDVKSRHSSSTIISHKDRRQVKAQFQYNNKP